MLLKGLGEAMSGGVNAGVVARIRMAQQPEVSQVRVGRLGLSPRVSVTRDIIPVRFAAGARARATGGGACPSGWRRESVRVVGYTSHSIGCYHHRHKEPEFPNELVQRHRPLRRMAGHRRRL